MWQSDTNQHDRDAATDGGRIEALDDEEIDDLCESINTEQGL